VCCFGTPRSSRRSCNYKSTFPQFADDLWAKVPRFKFTHWKVVAVAWVAHFARLILRYKCWRSNTDRRCGQLASRFSRFFGTRCQAPVQRIWRRCPLDADADQPYLKSGNWEDFHLAIMDFERGHWSHFEQWRRSFSIFERGKCTESNRGAVVRTKGSIIPICHFERQQLL
jgi:hypothetical protein